MKPKNSLRRLLQSWQVNPKPDPAFAAKVYKRILLCGRRRPKRSAGR